MSALSCDTAHMSGDDMILGSPPPMISSPADYGSFVPKWLDLKQQSYSDAATDADSAASTSAAPTPQFSPLLTDQNGSLSNPNSVASMKLGLVNMSENESRTRAHREEPVPTFSLFGDIGAIEARLTSEVLCKGRKSDPGPSPSALQITQLSPERVVTLPSPMSGIEVSTSAKKQGLTFCNSLGSPTGEESADCGPIRMASFSTSLGSMSSSNSVSLDSLVNTSSTGSAPGQGQAQAAPGTPVKKQRTKIRGCFVSPGAPGSGFKGLTKKKSDEERYESLGSLRKGDELGLEMEHSSSSSSTPRKPTATKSALLSAVARMRGKAPVKTAAPLKPGQKKPVPGVISTQVKKALVK